MVFTRDWLRNNPHDNRTCKGCTCFDCVKSSDKNLCNFSFNNCELCTFFDNYHIYACEDKDDQPYRMIWKNGISVRENIY